MWPFRRKIPRGFESLENRIATLELANAERQVTVLNTVEKVLAQLGARERARTRRNDAAGDTEPNDLAAPHPSAPLPGIQSYDRFRAMSGR